MDHIYAIDPEQYFMGEIYRGMINPDLIIAGIERLARDANFNAKFDLIVDLREAIIEMSPQELQKIMAFHFKVFGCDGGRTAFLVTTPMETALVSLFQMKMTEERIIQIFSTLAGALRWLNSGRKEPPRLPSIFSP